MGLFRSRFWQGASWASVCPYLFGSLCIRLYTARNRNRRIKEIRNEYAVPELSPELGMARPHEWLFLNYPTQSRYSSVLKISFFR